MDDAPETAAGDDDGTGSAHAEGGHAASDEINLAPPTTLVEVTPGVAVLFGEVPDGVELIDPDLIPSFDWAQLSTALGSLGNAGTIVGNVAEAASSAEGLFRVNDATLSLLKSGGEMAGKDGAKLGAIFKNGKVVGQARFIPASMTATAAIAAIGPAVAMIALQMQLGEISSLVRTSIALTTQTLQAIRSDQWAELRALVKTVDGAFQEARELGSVNESVWELVSHEASAVTHKWELYRENVGGHVRELGKLGGRARRHYLESNAQAIIFDTHALLNSLMTYAQYQALRAARARIRSANDATEGQLFNRITTSTPTEIEASLDEIRLLTESLVRELRIIAELPGRATAPLTKRRKDSEASRLTCVKLLEAIGPLADRLRPAVRMPVVPDTVCAPEGLDLEPYLHVLHWFLEDGETLRGVAFPYEVGTHSLAGVVPAILAGRVDATWKALAPGRAGVILEKFASSTFVAVTDRRIITADPRSLLRLGELGSIHSLDEVQYVRPRSNHGAGVRPTIDVTTDHRDIHWMFPDTADLEHVDNLAALLSGGTPSVTPTPVAIEQSDAPGDTDGS